MLELTLISALLIGLLGSSHCVGMCGGLCSLLGVSKENPNYLRLLSYNVGRLFTYTTIGAAAGVIGEQLVMLTPFIGGVLRTMAGLLLIAMGLYVSQLWMGLTRLEQLGSYCWKYIQPLTKFIFPISTHHRALCLGVLWGLLPCGLVYSTLSWALATASWQQSALLMLMFGLGTLPAMLLVGSLNQHFLHRLRGRSFRLFTGFIVVAMGLVTLLVPWVHLGQNHQHGSHQHSSTQFSPMKDQINFQIDDIYPNNRIKSIPAILRGITA